MSRTFWHLPFALLGVLVAAAQGEELPAAGDAPAAVTDEIAGLIRQLDEPGFAARQEASNKLLEAGLAALPQVEQAAAGGSREASARAFEVLKRHMAGGDTGDSVRDVLGRLAGSKDPATAQRARNILNPPPAASMSRPIANVGFGNGPFRAANVQIQLGLGGGGRRVQIQEANGRREVEVEDSNRKTKFQSFPSGRIDVQITEKENGKERTRTIEARDLGDLKKLDLEAARTFEQFSRPVAAWAGGIPPPPNAQQILDTLRQRAQRR